jgi:hypothetical protein
MQNDMNVQETLWYYYMMKDLDKMLNDSISSDNKDESPEKEKKEENSLYVSWNKKENHSCQK